MTEQMTTTAANVNRPATQKHFDSKQHQNEEKGLLLALNLCVLTIENMDGLDGWMVGWMHVC